MAAPIPQQVITEFKKDPFARAVLHHTRIDWDDPTLTPDILSRYFVGKCRYIRDYEWKRKEKNQFGPAGGDMEHIEIEREILAEANPREWHGISKVGKPYYKHFLTLMKLMFPRTDITDTIADACMFFCWCMGYKKKILNIIGGQNMGKSAASARIAFVTLFINPEYTMWTVANPFDKVADCGIWGELEVLWDDLAGDWPPEKGDVENHLFPNGKKFANMRIEVIQNRPKAARIILQNIKHEGKGKGHKSRKGKHNENLGIFGQIIDEINHVDNPSWLKTVVNRSSQKNFIAVTSQNYLDPEDMGGIITEPVPTYGGPDTIDKLDVDSDFFWHSKEAGITLRFDGHNAPNILAKRVIYEYLFDQDDLERIAEGGKEGPNYMSQVRSFPTRGAAANSLLSRAAINVSRHLDQYYTLKILKGLAGFCDPAFGGRDDAVIGSCKWGSATISDAEGRDVSEELFVVPEAFRTLKLTNGATFNDHWAREYMAVGMSLVDENEGDEISFEDQIAFQCLKYCKERGIPMANFGFDFSMRPHIVTSFNRFMGWNVVAFNYNMEPEGLPIIGMKAFTTNKDGDSRELCRDRCTELGMLAADYIKTKCVRGGEHLGTALVQMSRTRCVQETRKYKIEKKAEYKARWNNVSPDHRDVYMGLAAMAAMRGFRSNLKGPGMASGPSIFNLLKNSGKFKTARFSRLLRD